MEDRRQKLYKHFLILMLLVTFLILFVTFCQYFLIIKINKEYADITLSSFLQYYVEIPAVIYGVSYIAMCFILDSPNIAYKWKDLTTILYLWILCTVICFVGSYSPSIFGCYCVPIVMSTIYGRRKLCRITESLCVVTLTQFMGTARLIRTCTERSGLHVGIAVLFLLVFILCNEILLEFVLDNNDEIQTHMDDKSRLAMKLQREPMTGLYNHTAFYEYLNECVKKRGESPLTLAVVDIDNFKKINDTYGHNNGDEVILNLARTLQKWCDDSNNYVCRYGGEEFAVIFPNVKVKQAKEAMEHVLEDFRNTTYSWLDGNITFSCGIFQLSSYTMTADEFFKVADKMLYSAKHNGKNQCVSG